MKTPEQKAEAYLKNNSIYNQIVNPDDLPEYQKRISDLMVDFYKSANEWISVEDELPKQITNTVEDKEKQIKKNIIKWLVWHIDEINNNDLSQEIPQEDRKYNEQILKEISECIEWLKKN